MHPSSGDGSGVNWPVERLLPTPLHLVRVTKEWVTGHQTPNKPADLNSPEAGSLTTLMMENGITCPLKVPSLPSPVWLVPGQFLLLFWFSLIPLFCCVISLSAPSGMCESSLSLSLSRLSEISFPLCGQETDFYCLYFLFSFPPSYAPSYLCLPSSAFLSFPNPSSLYCPLLFSPFFSPPFFGLLFSLSITNNISGITLQPSSRKPGMLFKVSAYFSFPPHLQRWLSGVDG